MILQDQTQPMDGVAPLPQPVQPKSVAGMVAATKPPSAAPSPTPLSPVAATMTPPAAAPSTPAAPLAPPMPVTAGVSLTPINPANDLRSQTISAGPGTDRFAIAKDQLKQFNDATDPYYQKSLRDATSQAAGAGRMGSGMLRTSLGDLASQRGIQLQTQGQTFLDNALTGSIDDAYKNLGITQQQQARQDTAQNTAFGQGATTAALGDQFQNSATNRALAQLNAGSAGSPADTELILSQLFGGQAAQGGAALSNLIGSTVNNNSQQSQTNQILSYLKQLGIGSPTVTTPGAIPTNTGGIVPTPAPASSGGLFNPGSWIG